MKNIAAGARAGWARGIFGLQIGNEPVKTCFNQGLEPVHDLNGTALGCNRDEWADQERRMG
jgi:hypothetical protein